MPQKYKKYIKQESKCEYFSFRLTVFVIMNLQTIRFHPTSQWFITYRPIVYNIQSYGL